MQKKYQCRYEFANESIWKQKRLLMLEAKKNDQEAANEEKKSAGVVAIEAFRKKTEDQASEQLLQTVDDGKKMLQKQVDNWWSNKFTLPTLSLNFSNKADLEKAVRKLAEARIKTKAENLSVSYDWIQRRAEGSLAVKNEKKEVLKEQIKSIDKMLSESNADKARIEQARASLGILRKLRMPFSDDLQRKIERLEKLRAMHSELISETEDSSERQKMASDEIKNIDGQVRGIILSKNPALAGELDMCIRAEVVSQYQYSDSGGIDAFFSRHQSDLNLTSIEKNTCKKLLKYLRNGSLRANLSGSRLGTFSKQDVENFYINQFIERGELNREEDNLAQRLDRLKTLPLGQPVKIFENGVFNVIGKPDSKHNGFMLKNGEQLAFIDTKDKNHPILTVENPDKTYTSVELTVEKQDQVNTIEVEFGVKKEEPLNPPPTENRVGTFMDTVEGTVSTFLN